MPIHFWWWLGAIESCGARALQLAVWLREDINTSPPTLISDGGPTDANYSYNCKWLHSGAVLFDLLKPDSVLFPSLSLTLLNGIQSEPPLLLVIVYETFIKDLLVDNCFAPLFFATCTTHEDKNHKPKVHLWRAINNLIVQHNRGEHFFVLNFYYSGRWGCIQKTIFI